MKLILNLIQIILIHINYKMSKLKIDYTIPLVGNKYCKLKPNKHDKDILLINENENQYDKKAIAVFSQRDNKYIKLGYIIKDKTELINNIKDNINSIKILRSNEKNNEKNNENRYFYYLGINVS
jgi:hypothetical protein